MDSARVDHVAQPARRWPFWTIVVGTAMATVSLDLSLTGGIESDYDVGDFFGASFLVSAVLAFLSATIRPLKTACRGLAVGIIAGNLALLGLLAIALMFLPGDA